ncbi:hypothetical protein AAG570_006537, partial [Ranatra chinensis]
FLLQIAVLAVVSLIGTRNCEAFDPSRGSYRYQYGVNDHQTGDWKSQQESRDGDVTRGEYSLLEPDGSLRTVRYFVRGSDGGFDAVVHRQSPPQHTQEYSDPDTPQNPRYLTGGGQTDADVPDSSRSAPTHVQRSGTNGGVGQRRLNKRQANDGNTPQESVQQYFEFVYGGEERQASYDQPSDQQQDRIQTEASQQQQVGTNRQRQQADAPAQQLGNGVTLQARPSEPSPHHQPSSGTRLQGASQIQQEDILRSQQQQENSRTLPTLQRTDFAPKPQQDTIEPQQHNPSRARQQAVPTTPVGPIHHQRGAGQFTGDTRYHHHHFQHPIHFDPHFFNLH